MTENSLDLDASLYGCKNKESVSSFLFVIGQSDERARAEFDLSGHTGNENVVNMFHYQNKCVMSPEMSICPTELV